MSRIIKNTKPYLRWQLLFAGALTGLLAVLFFGIIHAATLVPIWNRLLGGIPFCLITGLSIGWLRFEMQVDGKLPKGIKKDMVFGLLIWMSLIPISLLGLLLRKSAMHNTESSWEVVFESFLAFASGIICGYLITKRFRFILAFGITSLSLALTQAGPVAFGNNTRSAWFFLALGMIYIISGFVIDLLERLIIRMVRKKEQDD